MRSSAIQQKTTTAVLGLAVILSAGTIGAEVTSENVAGYVGPQPSADGEIAVVGKEDSLLRQPRLTGIPVRLRDLSFVSLDFRRPLLDRYPVYWASPSGGTLSGLEVAGKPRRLTSPEIQDGRVLTEEWGPVPVYFLVVPREQGERDIAVCILILDGKQMAALRVELSREQGRHEDDGDESPGQGEKTEPLNQSNP